MGGDGAEDGGPDWDPKLAEALLGKLVLAGITDLAANGTLIGHRQLYGYATKADPREGIALRLEGAQAGEEFVLPPDTRPFRVAALGEYLLRGTGEVVTDPDFLATWEVRQRDKTQDH